MEESLKHGKDAVIAHLDAAEMRARASPSAPRHPHLAERALRELALGDLRGHKLRSDRYAAAVDHHMHFVPFPRRVVPTAEPPFSR